MPNARITFASDPEERSRGEDSLCAYTWQQNLLNPDNPELNVYLPMVRAAVRSMDAITEFSQQELDTEIEKYVISGASKRGWTTWLTGAMDQDRIIGILPVVWDAINVAEIFHHQIKSYGGWSWAVEDYVENNIPLYLDTPELEVMQDLIDPYRYRDRLTMPKLVITGLMDEFQMADDEQFWWDDMPGPKWLVKSPNTEHTQVTGIGVAVPMMGTWLTYLLNDWELPYITWDYEEDSGDITVEVHDGEVYTAQKWYATSCSQDRRDFRLANLDDPCECGIQVDDYCSTTSYLWSKETLRAQQRRVLHGPHGPSRGRQVWGLHHKRPAADGTQQVQRTRAHLLHQAEAEGGSGRGPYRPLAHHPAGNTRVQHAVLRRAQHVPARRLFGGEL